MIKENNKRIDRVEFIFLEYCLDKLLNNIQDRSLIYFNNLNYYIRQFNKYDLVNLIQKWTKTTNTLIKYKWKIIYFKDSLSINSMKFYDFPNSFCLECGVKEIFHI